MKMRLMLTAVLPLLCLSVMAQESEDKGIDALTGATPQTQKTAEKNFPMKSDILLALLLKAKRASSAEA